MANVTTPSDPTFSGAPVSLPSVGGPCGTLQQTPAACPAITFIPRDKSQAVFIPGSAHTLDGFREWALSEDFPDRGRFTFAGGELIVDMSPEYIETHNLLKIEITGVINQLAKTRSRGRVFADGCLFSSEVASISTEPDALFVSSGTWQAGRCQIRRGARPGVGDELIGSPDWVLEILSPSSVRKDKQLLFEGYFRAGISEYWLINALGNEIDFQIFTPGPSGFTRTEPRNGWLASPTFGCPFRVTGTKAEDGLWDYTLHIQESS